MDLKSGYPYFFIKSGLCRDYTALESDHETEVLILGGGISGALMAYELITHGINCTIIDKRSIGYGSTSASTSLLQYEIDVPLYKLAKKIGKDNAVFAYKACSDSIDKLKKIADKIGFKGLKRCSSLYFAHTKQKGTFLKEEFGFRKAAGFDVNYLDKEKIENEFCFASKEAILSKQAAKTDAYLFSHFLHAYNQKKGCKVFEATNIKTVMHHKTNIEAITDKGHKIKAKKIIYATGYEAVKLISKQIVKLTSTYACVSEKISELPAFFKDTLLWNTHDPYLYIREDNDRIIVGGRDEEYYDPERREAALNKKAQNLEQDFKKLFPTIDFKMQFFWAGTFGSTKDGLPYIGPYAKMPNSYFALGFGGNGITFSAIAAELITKHIKGEKNCIPGIFSFNR